MGACAAAGGAGGGSSELQAHTLTRHNNILLEFSREFARTRGAVTTNLERAQLLGVFGKAGSSTRDGAGGGSSAGAEVLSETARLLNERNSIHSALSQADDVIKQAYATSSSLAQQRSLLGGTFSKVTLLGNRIPGLNTLLSAIRRKRSRDTLILASVVAACTLFILVYWLNK
ncbi:hypothetical protein CLOM_g4820 [Closterium sp. NIES-68]|nr:hypothetical protein CLOM_g4820 [Closterium sp. NIES-68]GJP68989.1 hypothetical protein CLOP_g25621 [Closterium sp. NIES-67]